MNKAKVRGNLAAVPVQLKDAAGQIIGLALKIGVNQIVPNSEGKPEQRTTYYPISVFGTHKGEPRFKVGALIEVTGSLKTYKARRDGSERYAMNIVAIASQVAFKPADNSQFARVKLVGNLAEAPAVRRGPKAEVVYLRVITNESTTGKDGARKPAVSKDGKPIVDGHDVVAFGPVAEGAKAFGKGDWVEVAGFLRRASYEKDGERKFRFEVVASKVVVGPKSRGLLSAASDVDRKAPQEGEAANPVI